LWRSKFPSTDKKSLEKFLDPCIFPFVDCSSSPRSIPAQPTSRGNIDVNTCALFTALFAEHYFAANDLDVTKESIDDKFKSAFGVGNTAIQKLKEDHQIREHFKIFFANVRDPNRELRISEFNKRLATDTAGSSKRKISKALVFVHVLSVNLIYFIYICLPFHRNKSLRVWSGIEEGGPLFLFLFLFCLPFQKNKSLRVWSGIEEGGPLFLLFLLFLRLSTVFAQRSQEYDQS